MLFNDGFPFYNGKLWVITLEGADGHIEEAVGKKLPQVRELANRMILSQSLHPVLYTAQSNCYPRV